MVVSFQQYAENKDFFSNFSADRLHDWSILLVIPLEFQKREHQPFSTAQPLLDCVAILHLTILRYLNFLIFKK